MEPDIYFHDNYGKLYERAENGSAMIFIFKHDYGTIKTQFIKREIPIRIDGQTYYDIVTAYGYGGPLIVEFENDKKEDLVLEFCKEFEQYCRDSSIVSEFIRFHPIVDNATDFKSIYQTDNIRKTVGTNLKRFADPFQDEFSKSCRKNVRKALRQGVTYRVSEKPTDISNFKEIYYSTMDRNNAAEYYYFDDKYFDSCMEYFRDNLLLVEAIYQENTIAAGIYFISNKTIHIHLSGTLSEYLYLSPSYILRYGTTIWGVENGFEMIHHGGGRTNSPDDPLYLFKKQFGKNTEFDFYTGKRIWNEEIYNKLVNKNNQVKSKEKQDPGYFPAYRA